MICTAAISIMLFFQMFDYIFTQLLQQSLVGLLPSGNIESAVGIQSLFQRRTGSCDKGNKFLMD